MFGGSPHGLFGSLTAARLVQGVGGDRDGDDSYRG
jgi:hypothetical protein